MLPSLILDPMLLVAGCCALALGFAVVGLVGLVVLAIEGAGRRQAMIRSVDVAEAKAERPVGSVDWTDAAA